MNNINNMSLAIIFGFLLFWIIIAVILLILGINMTKAGNIWGILIAFLGFGFIGVIPTIIIYNDIKKGIREPITKKKRGDN